MDAQADLCLCYPHTHKDMFLHGLAQMMYKNSVPMIDWTRLTGLSTNPMFLHLIMA